MTEQNPLKQAYPLPKWFWGTLVVIIVVVIGLAGYFFYWRTGWPGVIQALNQCEGKLPTQANSFIESTYRTPSDDKYRIPGQNGYRTYFCTEDEAKAAGYKHSNL